jgi:membrane peptidoglycan carboxypeptidase
MEKLFKVSTYCLILWFVSVIPNLFAAVYTWTDENGVKHYSNVAPSESAGETIEQKDEVSGDPGEDIPAGPDEQATPEENEAVESGTPTEPAPDEADQEENEPADASGASQPPARDDAVVGMENSVKTEKNRVRELARALTEGRRSGSELLEDEKKRLEQIIQSLQAKPLDQFGSQKNKTRQIGFYQYRLQELLSSPETYLDYGESEGVVDTAEGEEAAETTESAPETEQEQ